MDEPQTQPTRSRRPSARDAKRAVRAAQAGHSIPLHHPQDSLLRGARRGRTRTDRAECRYDPRGDRHRVPRGRGGALDLEERGRRRSGRARAHAARHVPAADPGDRAARVHRSTPGIPRATCTIGGKNTVFAPAYGSPVHLQPRRRAPLRAHRGLPQLREARLPVEVAAPLRRDDLRARGPAGQQAPLRHGLQPHEVQRQGLHGVRDAPGARERHGRDGEDPVRRRMAWTRRPAGRRP